MVRFYSAPRSAAALKQTTAEMNNIDHRSAISSRGTLHPGFPVLHMPADIQSFPHRHPHRSSTTAMVSHPKIAAQPEDSGCCHDTKSAQEQSDKQLRASTWSNSTLDLILTDLSGLNGSESIHVLLEHPSVLSYCINDQYPHMVMVFM